MILQRFQLLSDQIRKQNIPQPLHTEITSVKTDFPKIPLLPEQSLIVIGNGPHHRLLHCLGIGTVLQPENNEICRIFISVFPNSISIFKFREHVLNINRGNSRTHADFFHCQRLLISCLADGPGNLAVQIPMGIHRAVAPVRIPVNPLIHFIHLLCPYPFPNSAAPYVQAPFDCGFRQGIFLCQLFYRHFPDIIIHKNIPVLRRKGMEAAEYRLIFLFHGRLFHLQAFLRNLVQLLSGENGLPLIPGVDKSGIAVVRNPPHPGFQRFNLVFSDAVQYMQQNLSRQILGVMPVVQAMVAEPENRFYIANNALLVHTLFSRLI